MKHKRKHTLQDGVLCKNEKDCTLCIEGGHCIPIEIGLNLYGVEFPIICMIPLARDSIILLKSMKTLIEPTFYKLPSYLVMPTYK